MERVVVAQQSHRSVLQGGLANIVVQHSPELNVGFEFGAQSEVPWAW
jgi:hypothetical protein